MRYVEEASANKIILVDLVSGSVEYSGGREREKKGEMRTEGGRDRKERERKEEECQLGST